MLLLLATGLVSPQPLAAQQASRYLPARDTVFIESINPHLMYWIRGNDTLGTPLRAVTIEQQVWNASASLLQVEVTLESLLPSSTTSLDTFTLHADGRVLEINGRQPALHGRVDLLPRLPEAPLSTGVEWKDTLSSYSTGPAGEHVYTVQRAYRVREVVDSVGQRFALVEATGIVRYRDGWWVDEGKSTAAWIDVSGPLEERFTFNMTRGQVAERAWTMDLQGEGGIPSSNGSVQRVRAGLISGSRHQVVSRKRAEALRENPMLALEPVPK